MLSAAVSELEVNLLQLWDKCIMLRLHGMLLLFAYTSNQLNK